MYVIILKLDFLCYLINNYYILSKKVYVFIGRKGFYIGKGSY